MNLPLFKPVQFVVRAIGGINLKVFDMKAIQFTFITDSSNRNWMKSESALTEMDSRLKALLKGSIKILSEGFIRKLDWDDGAIQWRKEYIIEKPKGYTYDMLFTLVNSIKPVRFKRINY